MRFSISTVSASLWALGFAAVASAQDAGGAVTALNGICAAHPKIPACDVFAVACKETTSDTCKAVSLAISACADSVASADPVCTGFQPSSGNGPVAGLPDAKTASGFVASICTEMPTMKDCQGDAACPAANATSGVSDCKVMSVYSALCLDMPNMTQCPAWKTFCDGNGKPAPFCAAGGAPAHDHSDGSHGHDNGSAASFSATGLAALFAAIAGVFAL
ncbi:hypothetical protein BC832DRAFT_559785 [Gaertneriomyces semiglobifer]|nr:hypothetical protein BC832DRAFT_559785 [Gaertneriomyces semiglobifer]